MRRIARFAIAAAAGLTLVLGTAQTAFAHLAEGASAPEFTAQAAQGGTVTDFDLKAALAKGPVVLYFFPKSFSSGCTIEAHMFSDNIAKYTALHATVIGVSGDDVDTQKRFSTEACRSTFRVVSDPGLKIAGMYQAKILGLYADRTSYVIAPDGKIALSYTNLDASDHVNRTIAALKTLEAK